MYNWLRGRKLFGRLIREYEKDATIPLKLRIIVLIPFWISIVVAEFIFIETWTTGILLGASALIISLIVIFVKRKPSGEPAMNTQAGTPEDAYEKFAQVYDAYTSSFADDLPLYESICNPNDHILEIGCGTGRIVKFLLDLRCQVTGVDISDAMLAKAREKLTDYTGYHLINHNFSNHLHHGNYSKVLITFYTFNYILDNPVAFLRNICQSVPDGTGIYLDLFYPRTLKNKEKDDQWIEYNITHNSRNMVLRDRRIMRQYLEYRTQIYLFEYQEIRIDTERRYYSPEMIKKHLRDAGFSDILFSVGYKISWSSVLPAENILEKNFLVSALKKKDHSISLQAR